MNKYIRKNSMENNSGEDVNKSSFNYNSYSNQLNFNYSGKTDDIRNNDVNELKENNFAVSYRQEKKRVISPERKETNFNYKNSIDKTVHNKSRINPNMTLSNPSPDSRYKSPYKNINKQYQGSSSRLKNYEDNLLSIKQSRILELELEVKELQEKNYFLETQLQKLSTLNTKNQQSSQDEITRLLNQIKTKDEELDFYYSRNANLGEELGIVKNKAENFSEIIHNLKASFNEKISEIENFTAHQEQHFKEHESNLISEINYLKEEKNYQISELILKHEKEVERILIINKETKDRLIQMNMQKDEEYVKLLSDFKANDAKLGEIIQKQLKEIELLKLKLDGGNFLIQLKIQLLA